jgi:hypothetical protein
MVSSVYCQLRLCPTRPTPNETPQHAREHIVCLGQRTAVKGPKLESWVNYYSKTVYTQYYVGYCTLVRLHSTLNYVSKLPSVC